MKWDWVNWSNLVWGTLVATLVTIELLGVFRVGPWRTLSETVWIDEERYNVLYFLIGGFLCALSLHFLSRVPFWWSLGIGATIALLSHLLSGWPKW